VRTVAAAGSVTTPSGGGRGRGKPVVPTTAGTIGKDTDNKKGLATRTPGVPTRPHSALGGRSGGSNSGSSSARRTVGKENIGKYGLPTPKSSKQRKPQSQPPQPLEKPTAEKAKAAAPVAPKGQIPAPKLPRN